MGSDVEATPGARQGSRWTMSRRRAYNWYVRNLAAMALAHAYGDDRYAAICAASCMVLYGYDNSTFNAISGSKNWDDIFSLA